MTGVGPVFRGNSTGLAGKLAGLFLIGFCCFEREFDHILEGNLTSFKEDFGFHRPSLAPRSAHHLQLPTFGAMASNSRRNKAPRECVLQTLFQPYPLHAHPFPVFGFCRLFDCLAGLDIAGRHPSRCAGAVCLGFLRAAAVFCHASSAT